MQERKKMSYKFLNSLYSIHGKVGKPYIFAGWPHTKVKLFQIKIKFTLPKLGCGE